MIPEDDTSGSRYEQPEFTAGGRIREPVACPMCNETFLAKADMQAHLLGAHKYAKKTRKVKTKKAKYKGVEKVNAFGLSFWLTAGAVLGICVLIGFTAPQLTRFILPVGLLALFLTRAGIFRK